MALARFVFAWRWFRACVCNYANRSGFTGKLQASNEATNHLRNLCPYSECVHYEAYQSVTFAQSMHMARLPAAGCWTAL